VRRQLRIAVAAALAAAALPALAAADQRITANPVDSYRTPNVTIAQGERLTFANFDLADSHNVTSRAPGPDGRPLFSTPTIGPGQERFVEGSQYLTGGAYGFFCTVHPFMTGTLTVTGSGTPEPRPPDTTPPGLSVRISSTRLSAVRSRRRLAVSATVDEAATVTLTPTVRSGRRPVTLAQGSIRLPIPGTRTAQLALTRAGRSALRGQRSITVVLAAQAQDNAGNRTAKSARRTLRR
jgi:plastocyanin